MSGRYEIKGSNTLYKVWGIITFVFAGLYGLVFLISLILFAVGGSMLGDAADGLNVGGYLDGYLDEVQGYVILFMLVYVLVMLIGLVIRILAGLYLVRPYVKSQGAMIAVAVFYFIMALFGLVSAIISGKSGSVFGTLYYLFCMGWAVATGVFLIFKQAEAITGSNIRRDCVPDGPHSYRGIPYTQVGADEITDCPGMMEELAHSPRAVIEGLFGDYTGQKYILGPGENCTIGRDSGCEIQLRHSKVSRIHCAVKFLPDGRFEITDYSYNGTYYENRALANGVAEIVEAGGMLVAGDADNVFSLNLC